MSDNFLEAEHAVIGGLLLDNSRIADIDLTPLDFCDAGMGQVFGAIRQLEGKNQPFDVFTVSDELKRTTGRDWVMTVATIQRNAVSAVNVHLYAQAVKRFRRNRDARIIAQQLQKDIGQDDGAIDRAIAELMALDTAARVTTHSMRDALKQAVGYIDAVHKKGGTLTGIPTGLKELDVCIGGYQDSDLLVLGARPAMGKTGFLLSSVLAGGVAAGIMSAEMSAMQLGLRAISNYGKVDSQLLRTANLDETDWPKINAAVHRLTELPIWIDDRSSPTIAEVQRWARKMKQKHGIKILFVDYLQRLKGNNPRMGRIDQVGEIVLGLKSLAKELNIPVVALAQVNRDVEKRPDKRPQMGDLANSSEIEKEADEIIMLYRDEVYNEDSDDKGIAEFNFEKNRHGPTGTVRAAWIPQYMLFADLAVQWHEQRTHQ